MTEPRPEHQGSNVEWGGEDVLVRQSAGRNARATFCFPESCRQARFHMTHSRSLASDTTAP